MNESLYNQHQPLPLTYLLTLEEPGLSVCCSKSLNRLYLLSKNFSTKKGTDISDLNILRYFMNQGDLSFFLKKISLHKLM